jgi:O-antigen ligase
MPLDYEPVFPSTRHQRRLPPPSENFPRPEKFKSFDDPTLRSPSVASEKAAPTATVLSRSADWIRSKGHTASFCALFVFSVVLYLRPYELIPALSSVTSMAFYTGIITLGIYVITQLVTEGNLTARTREIDLALLLGLFALLSMPMAINRAESWTTFTDLFLKALLIFIVIVNTVRTKNRLLLLMWLALGVSIYLSIGAFQDYQMGVLTSGKVENSDLRIMGRIKGLFANPNDLALHLVTMVPIAVSLAFATAGILRKVLYLGAALSMVLAIVVTFSRGGFLGLVAASIFLVFKLGRGRRLSTTTAFVLAIVLFFVLAPGSYGGRLSTIFDTAGDLTGSATQRSQVLQRSILVTLRYPVFGVGIGNFHYKSFQELGTHNAYTQVSSEMGVVAMVVYMMFLIYPYRRLKEIEKATDGQKKDRFYYYLSIGLQAGLIGYMVASFFAAVAYQWYIYYLVGYAIAIRRIYLAHTQAASTNDRGQVLTGSSSPSGSPA